MQMWVEELETLLMRFTWRVPDLMASMAASADNCSIFSRDMAQQGWFRLNSLASNLTRRPSQKEEYAQDVR